MSTPTDYSFSLAPSLSIRMERFGESSEPVLIIDDVLQNPDSMVRYACDEVTFEPAFSATGGFPGLRAPAPLNYVEQLGKSLGPTIIRAWGLGRARLSRARCFFGLVTLKPEELKPLQTVPHFDTTEPLDFAMLHYFSRPEQGGTAFYRHLATGLERVHSEHDEEYTRQRDAELKATPAKPDFIRGDTADFKQIGKVEARFNRLVIYRSQLLHSGLIPEGARFSADPKDGRLTTNVFISFKAH